MHLPPRRLSTLRHYTLWTLRTVMMGPYLRHFTVPVFQIILRSSAPGLGSATYRLNLHDDADFDSTSISFVALHHSAFYRDKAPIPTSSRSPLRFDAGLLSFNLYFTDVSLQHILGVVWDGHLNILHSVFVWT